MAQQLNRYYRVYSYGYYYGYGYLCCNQTSRKRRD